MGWGAGRKFWEILGNASRVIAVEVLCACAGIGHRRPLTPAPATAAALEWVRRRVPPLADDRPVAPDIEAVAEMIDDGSLVRAAENALGAVR
jgi:histidine ammonia-lyase